MCIRDRLSTDFLGVGSVALLANARTVEISPGDLAFTILGQNRLRYGVLPFPPIDYRDGVMDMNDPPDLPLYKVRNSLVHLGPNDSVPGTEVPAGQTWRAMMDVPGRDNGSLGIYWSLGIFVRVS